MTTSKDQIKENQHWVPRFYLKKFADDKNFLQVLDIKKKEIVKPRPYSGVCYDKFYYGEKTGQLDKTSQEFEDILQRFENNIAPRIKNFEDIVYGYGKIEEEQIYYMACFMCLLWARGPYLRKMVNDLSEKATKWAMGFSAKDKEYFKKSVLEPLSKNEMSDLDDNEIEETRQMIINKEYDVEFGNIQHLLFFGHLEEFSNLFYNKFWRIYIANSSEFITSDNPVSEFIPKRNTMLGPTFLERKHYFAVSPNVLVELIDPISGKKIKRKKIEKDKVLEYNTLVANHSMNYCYAKNKDVLEDMVDYRRKIILEKQKPARVSRET